MRTSPSTTMAHYPQVQWASGLNVLAGLWVIISPWVLGFARYDGPITSNNVICGIIVAVLAAIQAYRPDSTQWLSWINVLLGIWLFISAFVFAGTTLSVPFWNNVILGVIVAVLGVISAWGNNPQTA